LVQDLLRRIGAMEETLMKRIAPEPKAEAELQFEPDLDVYENDREFLIQAAVPGAEPQQIRIEATPHTITMAADIAGGHPVADGQDAAPDGKRHRRSRHAGHDRYHFVYTLHVAIRPETARAAFRNGIVEIHLDKVLSAPVSVAVPVTLADGAVNSRPRGEAVVFQSAITIAHSREGSPGQKLGASYAANAGEDHASKAQSVGEQIVPGQATGRQDNIRTSESGGQPREESISAKPRQI